MKHLLLVSLSAFIIFGASAQTLPAYVPLVGLEAWYAFDSSAADSSGNGNNGTVHGALAVPDRFGHPNSAYYFNGLNSYIIVPPSSTLNITSDITISTWVKSNFNSTSQTIIYFRGDTRSAYDPYILYVTYDSVIFLRNTGAGLTFNQVAFPKSILDTTVYHHIVATYSASDDSMKIYLDNQLKSSRYRPGTISYYTDTAHNTIGACDYGTWQYFKGTIDDIGTWNKRLSVCEISKLYYALPSFITAHPTNATVPVGGTANFVISDTGGTATYQWQENSGTGFADITGSGFYSGVTTKHLVITPVPGDLCNHWFRCYRTNGICADTSLPAQLICASSAGIGGISAEASYLNISPNPTEGRFTITGLLSTGTHGTATIDILNLLGQVVYSRQVNVTNNRIDEQFFLQGMAKGTYFLRVQSETERRTLRITVD